MKTSTWKAGIGVIVVLAGIVPPLGAYDTFEHRHLGNVAFEQAKRTMEEDLPLQVKKDLARFEKELKVNENPCRPSSQLKPSQCMAVNALKNTPVRFGDFAALAGDHAGTPTEVYEMVLNFLRVREDSEEVNRVLATRRQWQRACAQMRAHYSNSYSDSEKLDDLYCVKDGGAKSPSADSTLPPTGYTPQRDEWSEFEGLPGFIDLVSSNQSHFPTHSWREYAVHHLAALQAARSYHDKQPECRNLINTILYDKAKFDVYGEAPLCHLRRALVFEGYAQHFLHDSFSSGHIGTEFGKCFYNKWVLCAPDKQLVNHIHNELNRLGVKVTLNQAGQEILKAAQKRLGLKDLELQNVPQQWLAAGDDYLMVPEAGFHRKIVSLIATASLIEVLDAMGRMGGSAHSLKEVCMQSVNIFPVAADAQLMRVIDRSSLCETERGPDGERFSGPSEDLAIFQADRPQFWPSTLWPDPGVTHRLLGRTMDERVRIYPLEGWKFMVSWGQAWGRFDELNADGTRQSVQNRSTNGTFEVGYVRKTKPWLPNYLGFGAAVTSGERIAIYPLSFGYWGGTDSRTLFWGLRMNAGLRIDEPLVESNPGQRRLSSMEFAFPLDLGFKVYKGVSFYIRPELLAIHFPGLAGSGDAQSAVVEHIFNGRGRLTFGLVLDFGEII